MLAKNEDRINHMIGDADEMMQLAKKALVASNDLLGDPKLRDDIKQTIAEMPVVLKETRTTVEKMGGTFGSLEQQHAEHRGPDQAAGRSRAGADRPIGYEHEETRQAQRQHVAVQRGA